MRMRNVAIPLLSFQNLQADDSHWTVDKYVTSQQASSCGDKSSSETGNLLVYTKIYHLNLSRPCAFVTNLPGS